MLSTLRVHSQSEQQNLGNRGRIYFSSITSYAELELTSDFLFYVQPKPCSKHSPKNRTKPLFDANTRTIRTMLSLSLCSCFSPSSFPPSLDHRILFVMHSRAPLTVNKCARIRHTHYTFHFRLKHRRKRKSSEERVCVRNSRTAGKEKQKLNFQALRSSRLA